MLFGQSVTLAVVGILSASASVMAAPPYDVLDSTTIPQFVEPMTIPPVMPTRSVQRENGRQVDYYEIEAVQLEQQVLPASMGLGTTTVFGFGAVGQPQTRSWPGYTIEATKNRPVRVKWINALVDGNNNYLPHLTPIDQTVHWANPPQQCKTGVVKTDCSGTNTTAYTGPVPFTAHLHGAHTGAESDGYPESWWLPAANNIPNGYASQGGLYDQYVGGKVSNGSATYQYRNDQEAATLWYHDHTLGMTRNNVYAGLAGFYLLRDAADANGGSLNLPAPAPAMHDPAGKDYYEIPILIQDRSFKADGDLFFPPDREYFDGYQGATIPDTAIHPIWNPEFFGNTMTVNGKTWPYLNVEKRKYRLRLLNGSNSRFLLLKMSDPSLTFTVFGSNGGRLGGTPEVLSELLIAPAERYDVVVDFSNMPVGANIVLQNAGPDGPFTGLPIDPAEVSDPATTDKVMQFNVIAAKAADNSAIPGLLPTIPALAAASSNVRELTLNENMLQTPNGAFPISALLGTAEKGALTWGQAITENPQLNSTETWRFANLTGDAHPIHLHLVQFRVISRTPFDDVAFAAAQQAWLAGAQTTPAPQPSQYINGVVRTPDPIEAGLKDTVIAYPGEITEIEAHFDLPGLFVWHCHILDHEDNEMMRPMFVGDPATSPVPVDDPTTQPPTPEPPQPTQYTLQAVHSGKLLDTSRNNVVQRSANGSNSQQWAVEASGNAFKVRNIASNQCMTMKRVWFWNYVYQSDCRDSDTQQWNINPAGDGYTLQSKAFGTCATVDWWSQRDGANISGFYCLNASNQRFRIPGFQ